MQDKSNRKSNVQRSQEMRARLIASARQLFSEKGFAETGTPEIVKHAEVTRGALYHHFEDKTDLFRAVARAEAEALEAAISASGRVETTPELALRSGTLAFFEAMSEAGRARILLVEGPAVLGISEMDDIDAGNGRASLLAGLKALAPERDGAGLEAMSKVLSAAFDRAALAIAEGEDANVYTDSLVELVAGLRRD